MIAVRDMWTGALIDGVMHRAKLSALVDEIPPRGTGAWMVKRAAQVQHRDQTIGPVGVVMIFSAGKKFPSETGPTHVVSSPAVDALRHNAA